MKTVVFILGSHPVLSAAELHAYGERMSLDVSWDLSRLPVALLGTGALPSPQEMLPVLGGTIMIGTMRATFAEFPSAEEILKAVPEILEPRQGKRLVGVSALSYSSVATVRPRTHHSTSSSWSGGSRGDDPEGLQPVSRDALASEVRSLAMELKREIGMKGTRVVFPPARRSDLSTAQLLHNRLPKDGTVIFFLVTPARSSPAHISEVVAGAGEPARVDLVTIEAIQDIEAYALRDRGRPHADPGTGMLPPKVAQMLLNFSLVPPASAEATAGRLGGTIYDPFCGVGTIPMEALLMGLKVVASDASPRQVERTRQNLAWLGRDHDLWSLPHVPEPRVFVHNASKRVYPLDPGSVDAVVTEGWLGPARSRSPLPREADQVFEEVAKLLQNLFSYARTVVRQGGRLLITLPTFRIGKRVVHFPVESVRAAGFLREPLIPNAWKHPLFREASSGTLLYGRPDAVVLREIIRWRRQEDGRQRRRAHDQ